MSAFHFQESHFDVAIYESLDQCSKILSDVLGIKFIVLYTKGMDVVFPRNPAYLPVILTQFGSTMTFFERVLNTLAYSLQQLFVYKLHVSFQNLRNKHFSDGHLVETAFDDAALRFILADYAIDYSLPLDPNYIVVGGFILPPPETLPTSVTSILDSSTKGVVVFSFGSLVKSEWSPWLQKIGKALQRLPFTVLWRIHQSEKFSRFGNESSNVYTYSWLPQSEILSHPNTVAYVSHGGRNSIHESAYYGVPSVLIPLTLEQSFQTTKLLDRNMAISLDVSELTEDILYEAIVEVITNTSYTTNAKIVSNLMHAKQYDQKEDILKWVKYVNNTNGAKHLSSNRALLNWWQINLVDVWSFIIFVVCLVVIVLGFCIKKLYRRMIAFYCRIVLKRSDEDGKKIQ